MMNEYEYPVVCTKVLLNGFSFSFPLEKVW